MAKKKTTNKTHQSQTDQSAATDSRGRSSNSKSGSTQAGGKKKTASGRTKSSAAKGNASKAGASKTGPSKAASSGKGTTAKKKKTDGGAGQSTPQTGVGTTGSKKQSQRTRSKRAATKTSTTKQSQPKANQSTTAQTTGNNTSSSKASQKKTSRKKTSQRKTARTQQGQGGQSATKQGADQGKHKSSGAASAPPPADPVDVESRTESLTEQPEPAMPADDATVSSNGEDHELTEQELKQVKTDLSNKELKELQTLLLERRAEITGDIDTMQAAREAARGGELSHMPLHMADAGSDAWEEEFTLGLMESERQLLYEIDEALLRMQKGTYGVCVISGKPINKARLEVAPWARYCIEVARQREKRGG